MDFSFQFRGKRKMSPHNLGLKLKVSPLLYC